MIEEKQTNGNLRKDISKKEKEYDELHDEHFEMRNTLSDANMNLQAKNDSLTEERDNYRDDLKDMTKLRDDYKESIELVLVVLGYTPPNFTFKKPGAFHKARWMAPLIYGLKIFLFRNALKKSKKEQLQLER